MHNPSQPVLKDIVLIGGGHSHVGVIKSFGMQPLPGVRLTVICTDVHTPYSGMLPGYVAGHYDYDQVHIDLARLAVFAGARLYRDRVIGIDRASRTVLCANRPPIPYDVLSINIGSSPQLHDVSGAAQYAVPVKPITGFNQRWLALLERVRQQPGPCRVAVVGAGAGGVELLLAMQWRLRHELQQLGRNPDELTFHLCCGKNGILPTHTRWVRQHFTKVLAERGVVVHQGAAVKQVQSGLLDTGREQIAVDEIIWVTRAGAAPWLRDTGLALDAEGFILVNDRLQSVTDPLVFAAGDIAAMPGHKMEKAGVFAVRQGPPLGANLRSSVTGKPLAPYRPQAKWLALISTGDRYAVASRGKFACAGAWVWRWKDWIDREFMQRFSDLPAMNPASPAATPSTPSTASTSPVLPDAVEARQASAASAMRCGGCGAKVGADVLSRALARLQPLVRDDVLLGLQHSDDAAVIRVPPGKLLVQSVDFFRSFIDDPYLFGKIAANHALGDIWAMGAEAQSASAIVTVPPGLARKTEDLLFQMMSGAVEVLNQAGCALVGGHTGEGQELALGFAVQGLLDEAAPLLCKGGLQAGQVLLLTKPLGTGTLLAAHMRGKAKGRWVDGALQAMQLSNQNAARCLRQHGATALTDVTGFGLVGHLLEMTRASMVGAELSLNALPLLAGAQECVAAGLLSSLQDANLAAQSGLDNAAEMASHARYPLLFDPQTAGPLLAGVPGGQVEACLTALQQAGYGQACVIGRVVTGEGQAAVRLLV